MRAGASLLVLGALLCSACASVGPAPRTDEHPAAKPVAPVFVAVYRWNVKPGCEARFRDAWRAETVRFREARGSYGTRLHRAEDGTFVATAFWPDRATWERAHQTPIDVPWAEAVIAECVLEKVEELHLDLLEDLSRLPAPPGR